MEIQVLGFRVYGFGDWGLGVWGLGLRALASALGLGFGFSVLGCMGFWRACRVCRVCAFILGVGMAALGKWQPMHQSHEALFGVQGLRVRGLGFRV